MNLRCTYCQIPFTLSRAETLAALQKMEAENLRHYDAHCPNCRRANSISKERLELFFPNWRQTLQDAANVPAPTAPTAAPSMPAKIEKAPGAPSKLEKATSSRKRAAKKPAAKPKAKPVAKKPTAKPAAKPKAKPAAKPKKK